MALFPEKLVWPLQERVLGLILLRVFASRCSKADTQNHLQVIMEHDKHGGGAPGSV